MFLISFYSLMVVLGTQRPHGAGGLASGDSVGGKFNNTYIGDRPKLLFSSVINLETNYIVLGNTVSKHSPFLETGVLVELSKGGDWVNQVTNSDTLTDRTGWLWNTLLLNTSGRLVFAGNGADTGQHLTFGFADVELDSINLFRYKQPNIFSYQGLSVVEHSANSYYVAGVHNVQSSFNANVLLAKIDSNGNKLWEKYYHQKAADYAKSIIALKNGNLLLGAERNDLAQTNVKSNTWLLEVDTGGNIVRQWFDPSDSTYVAEGLHQTQDGGFIYGAQKKYLQNVNAVYKVATLVKMDSNFNKQWTFTDGSYNTETAIVDLEELPDGSFVGCGNKPFYNGDSSMISGWIVKLDANGNVIWNRTYAGFTTSQSYNYLSDIDVLEDGSLIAVGQCQKSGATPPQVGWFLKLDSNGCEVENCLLGIDEVSSQTQIQVYPNPTKSSFQVKLPDDMNGAVVAVYDVAGALVTQAIANGHEAMVDVQGLSNGLYVVVATSSISPEGEEQYKTARAKLIVE